MLGARRVIHPHPFGALRSRAEWHRMTWLRSILLPTSSTHVLKPRFLRKMASDDVVGDVIAFDDVAGDVSEALRGGVRSDRRHRRWRRRWTAGAYTRSR